MTYRSQASGQIYFEGSPRLCHRTLSSPVGRMAGVGLFVADFCRPGDLIMGLDWENVASAQILAWEDVGAEQQDRTTAIAPGWYFHPSKAHPLWYLNHSCNPNIGYRNWAKYESRSSIPLVALRDINPGDQVVIDYSTMTTGNDGEEEGVPWTMKCLCGESNCRGILTDFSHLPYNLQTAAVRLRTVPAFILNESPMLVEALRLRGPEVLEEYQSVLGEQFALASRFAQGATSGHPSWSELSL